MKHPIKYVLFLIAAACLCMPLTAATPGDGAGANRTPTRLSRSADTPVRHAGRNHRNYRHRGHHYRGYGRYYGGYGGYYGGFYRGIHLNGWYGPGYGYGFYGPYFRHWPAHYYGAPDGYSYQTARTGALDLNIKPKSTRVYLNGIHIGKARSYDGWPGYLWVPEGEHELIFYKKGYETVRKKVEVLPGKVLRADLAMVAGLETPVEAVTTARQERIDQRKSLYERYGKNRPNPTKEVVGTPAGEAEAVATLVLEIRPADATLYLDGKFLGSAAHITADGGTLSVTEGPHTLEVMRPGHKPQKTTFDAKAGNSLRLAIQLEIEAQ